MRLLSNFLLATLALSCAFNAAAQEKKNFRISLKGYGAIPKEFKFPAKFYPVMCLDDNNSQIPVFSSIHTGAPYLQMMLDADLNFSKFKETYLKPLRELSLTYKKELAGQEITLILERSWAGVARGVNLDRINENLLKHLHDSPEGEGVLSYWNAGTYVKRQVRVLLNNNYDPSHVEKVRYEQQNNPKWALALNPIIDTNKYKGGLNLDEKIAPIVVINWNVAYAVNAVLKKAVLNTNIVPFESKVRIKDQIETKDMFQQLQRLNKDLGFDKVLIASKPSHLVEACDEDKTKTDAIVPQEDLPVAPPKPNPPKPQCSTRGSPAAACTPSHGLPRPE
eukprot:GDKI01020070.1.p1 GENE.GDKI01020070.1~~GDKI01020070.1.p1  ORF type:complete len:336 (+),score=64.53 GDKI01020070.1:108-1115(+)